MCFHGDRRVKMLANPYTHKISSMLKVNVRIEPGRHCEVSRRDLPSTNEPAKRSPEIRKATFSTVKSCQGTWLPSTETISSAEPRLKTTQNIMTLIRCRPSTTLTRAKHDLPDGPNSLRRQTGEGGPSSHQRDSAPCAAFYTDFTWAEDMATQGCDRSADPAAGRQGGGKPPWLRELLNPFWRERDKSREREGRALALNKDSFLIPHEVGAVFVRQLRGPHLSTWP